jgi:hypothetical protein
MRRAVGLIIASAAVASLQATPAATQTDAQRKQVEEGQKQVVAQIKPTLPRKIDEVTTLIDVASSGVILAYTFSVDTTNYKLAANFIELVRKNNTPAVCKTEVMVSAMKLGAVYQYIYVDLEKKPLGQFDVKSTDCA